MVCDMIFICPLLDFSIHVIGSTPLLLLHYLIEKTGDSTHRRTFRWGWGAATPPSPCPPPEFRATKILGAAREIWANQIFTKVFMFHFAFFFFERVIFFYFELKSAWKSQLNSSSDCVLRAVLSNTRSLC